MRYRRIGQRYAMAVRSGSTWSMGGEVWQSDRLRLLVQRRWQPDADAYETADAFEVLVDLAGTDEDDLEVQVFEDALIVEGSRLLCASKEDGVYHMAAIRQGPFRLELALPASIDTGRVVARYDRGLLRVTLPKLTENRT